MVSIKQHIDRTSDLVLLWFSKLGALRKRHFSRRPLCSGAKQVWQLTSMKPPEALRPVLQWHLSSQREPLWPLTTQFIPLLGLWWLIMGTQRSHHLSRRPMVSGFFFCWLSASPICCVYYSGRKLRLGLMHFSCCLGVEWTVNARDFFFLSILKENIKFSFLVRIPNQFALKHPCLTHCPLSCSSACVILKDLKSIVGLSANDQASSNKLQGGQLSSICLNPNPQFERMSRF